MIIGGKSHGRSVPADIGRAAPSGAVPAVYRTAAHPAAVTGAMIGGKYALRRALERRSWGGDRATVTG